MTSNAQPLRRWQAEARELWLGNGRKGIIGAVTGGGKTVFALACIREAEPEAALIIVPTLALLDQWWEEAAAYFRLNLDDINMLTSRSRVKRGMINIGVINTVAKFEKHQLHPRMMIVIDECHKAASEEFSAVLGFPASASLGLSATPERPYDDWLRERLIPSLGSVLYNYTYEDALRDGVIVPFELRNIVFDLEEDREKEYERLTRTIARRHQQYGADAPETIAAFLQRARVLNRSPRRVEVALRLIMAHRGQRTLVFHEDIESCGAIGDVLQTLQVPAKVYHSDLSVRERAEALRSYRKGEAQVLITCRALDEGFNVPETAVGGDVPGRGVAG